MGKVRMMESSRIPGVYAVESDYEYTYCDDCGSFSIETVVFPSSSARKAVSIVGVLLVVSSIGWFLLAVEARTYWLSGCIAGAAGALALLASRPKATLRCRKCGAQDITNFNFRHYKECDESVVDVPINMILRRHLQTRVY